MELVIFQIGRLTIGIHKAITTIIFFLALTLPGMSKYLSNKNSKNHIDTNIISEKTFGHVFYETIVEEIENFVATCQLEKQEKDIITDFFFDRTNNSWHETFGHELGFVDSSETIEITRVIIVTSRNACETKSYFPDYFNTKIPVLVVAIPGVSPYIIVDYVDDAGLNKCFFIFSNRENNLKYLPGKSISLLIQCSRDCPSDALTQENAEPNDQSDEN